MISRILTIAMLCSAPFIYPMYTIERAIAENNIDAVARMIAADKTIVNKLCNTGDLSRPLHLAANKNSVRMAQLLVEKGAIVNIRNINGDTPLSNSIVFNSLAVARFLLEHGADPNVGDFITNCIPLHYAASQGNLPAVDLLLRFGSKTKHRSRILLTPRSWLANQDIANIFCEWQQAHEGLMALSAAMHPRLGEHSPAQVLTRDDLSIIAQHLMNLEKPLDMQYSRPQRANYCSTIAKLAALGGISAATAAYLLPYLSNS